MHVESTFCAVPSYLPNLGVAPRAMHRTILVTWRLTNRVWNLVLVYISYHTWPYLHMQEILNEPDRNCNTLLRGFGRRDVLALNRQQSRPKP